VFEQQYGNLGYWSNAADQATWRVRVAKAGAYRVSLDYACDDANAGNTLLIEAAGSAVSYKVEGTRMWDVYRKQPSAHDLPTGEITVVARPGGEPKNAIVVAGGAVS
jgi:hypothetical protein